MEKSFLGRPLCLWFLAAAQEITHAAHSLSRLDDVACKGGLCFNPSCRVARLAGVPSLKQALFWLYSQQRLKTKVFSASVKESQKVLLTLKARESLEAVFAY